MSRAKIYNTETLKNDIRNWNVDVVCNKMRTAATYRIMKKTLEAIAICRKLVHTRREKRYWKIKWQSAAEKVNGYKHDLAEVEAEVNKLQDSISILIDLPEAITNFVDTKFGNQQVIFGIIPPANKIFR